MIPEWTRATTIAEGKRRRREKKRKIILKFIGFKVLPIYLLFDYTVNPVISYVM